MYIVLFPLVYVCVWQQGSLKLHPYNSDPQRYVFNLTFAHLVQFGTCITNFAVMIEMLVFVTITKMQLVEASQHHCHLTQCLLSPSSTLIECNKNNPTSAFLGAVRRSCSPGDQWGHKNVSLGARSLKTLLLAPPLFFL